MEVAMPWQECSVMDRRYEFVQLAHSPDCNMSHLCRCFGISRKTGYKWLARYRSGGYSALSDRDRTPHTIHGLTPPRMEAVVLKVRLQHPSWGGRKIHRRLQDLRAGGALADLADLSIPSPGSITRILRRHDLLPVHRKQMSRAVQRFERSQPNELWQMDYKGDVRLQGRQVSHPLTVLDDHSRFNLCLQSCKDQQYQTVKQHLTHTFRRYGMPTTILCDNGAPWGSSHPSLTRFGLWLMRLGVCLIHGRPFHPQTQGKEERFHRTLKAEVLNGRLFHNHSSLQTAFDHWRMIYNFERPHEALDLDTPGSHYQPSHCAFPESLPEIQYEEGTVVRKVNNKGTFSFRNRTWKTSKALYGERVAVYPTKVEGVYSLAYASFRIGEIHWCDMDGKQEATVRMFSTAKNIKMIVSPYGETKERTT